MLFSLGSIRETAGKWNVCSKYSIFWLFYILYRVYIMPIFVENSK